MLTPAFESKKIREKATLTEVSIQDPCLFRITKFENDKKCSLYLLGTDHEVKLKYFSQQIQTNLLSHHHLFVEYVMNYAEVRNSIKEFDKRYKQDFNWFACIEDKDIKNRILSVNKLLREIDSDFKIENFTLELAEKLVYLHEILQMQGMDMELIDYYQSNQKQVGALETANDKLKKLEFFDESNIDSNRVEQRFSRIIDFTPFNPQELPYITKGDFFESYFILNDRRRDERNQNMYEKLVNLLRAPNDTSILVAVGAAHLAGDNGLLNKLKSDYLIEKANSQGEFHPFDYKVADMPCCIC